MIISNLLVRDVLIKVCQASPVFRHQLITNKLLKTWNALHKELDYSMFNHILVLVKYPKTQKPIPAFDDTDSTGCPSKYLPDPLFTPEQHLIFEMHAINQRMAKCFDLGPPLVPIYRAKYPDFFGGHFSDFLAKSFGDPGEHLPTMMPLIGSGIQRRIFYLLLAIEATDQCPSVFDKSFDESAKQQSIREQRFRRLARGWIMKVPSAVWDDFGRFSHSTEKYD